MTSFKVGDKVRRVTNSWSPEHYGVLGEVYEVLNVARDTIKVIRGPGGWATGCAFELVKEENPPETNFKVGDRIKRIKTSKTPHLHGTLGEVYTVLEMQENHPVVIFGRSAAASYMFELVTEEEEKPMYEVGEVYLWKGGVCPLPKGTQVDIRFGRSDMSTIDSLWSSFNNATGLFWEHKFCGPNIVMFKVVSYPKPEPVKRSVTLELTEEQLKAVESVLLKEGRL